MITVGLSSHRLEALPYARMQMERHQTIVLEEPPSPHLEAMLAGKISIADYLLEREMDFPRFQEATCKLLRELYRRGHRILQVEPYLERLEEIHLHFAAGGDNEEIKSDSRLGPVYAAEHLATGALLDFYRCSHQGDFRQVVEAVKEFARTDAQRLDLRQRLRAAAIREAVDPGEDAYVEAGYIHYPLWRHLQRLYGPGVRVRPLFLLGEVGRELGGKRRNLGPGDLLTLHYLYHGRMDSEMEDLLAARSLVYIKLLAKDELEPGVSPWPHAANEARANQLVDRLSYRDCERLYPRLLGMSPEQAESVVSR